CRAAAVLVGAMLALGGEGRGASPATPGDTVDLGALGMMLLIPVPGLLIGTVVGAVFGFVAGLGCAAVAPHLPAGRPQQVGAVVVAVLTSIILAAVHDAVDLRALDLDLGLGLAEVRTPVLVLPPALVLGALLARSSRSISAERARLGAG
ncbi:MAG: hypothetical protein Q4G40_12400, partial [Brachybacterium sp.]|nr:hypothetical protein [Brachybacterium sp.]